MRTNSENETVRLTPKKLELLKAVHRFRMSQRYLPTIAELAFELGISRSTVFEHITELRKKGLLSACLGRTRSLRLTSQALELLDSFAAERRDGNLPEGIALVGRVAAGEPVEAIEDRQSLSLKDIFGCGDDVFALKVAGDSMVNDGIYDGDYVICRRSRLANNGQLVIAVVDGGSATLKRFYKQCDCVRLEPANYDYEPIYSDNCRIEAAVIGLVRKM